MTGNTAISILYEDADVVCADKPCGMASVAQNAQDQNCLRAVLARQTGCELLPVHRLDKEVSGVIIFAKHPEAHVFLNEQFSARKARKRYTALVHGLLLRERGTICRPIREFGSGRMGVDKQAGKQSTTRFEVLHRLPPYTLLDAFPVTGRRHQVRVHLYALGHPIVGDTRYGDRKIQEKFPRLMLHARSLRILLPAGTTITVESPLPEEFSERGLRALPS